MCDLSVGVRRGNREQAVSPGDGRPNSPGRLAVRMLLRKETTSGRRILRETLPTVSRATEGLRSDGQGGEGGAGEGEQHGFLHFSEENRQSIPVVSALWLYETVSNRKLLPVEYFPVKQSESPGVDEPSLKSMFSRNLDIGLPDESEAPHLEGQSDDDERLLNISVNNAGTGDDIPLNTPARPLDTSLPFALSRRSEILKGSGSRSSVGQAPVTRDVSRKCETVPESRETSARPESVSRDPESHSHTPTDATSRFLFRRRRSSSRLSDRTLGSSEKKLPTSLRPSRAEDRHSKSTDSVDQEVSRLPDNLRPTTTDEDKNTTENDHSTSHANRSKRLSRSSRDQDVSRSSTYQDVSHVDKDQDVSRPSRDQGVSHVNKDHDISRISRDQDVSHVNKDQDVSHVNSAAKPVGERNFQISIESVSSGGDTDQDKEDYLDWKDVFMFIPKRVKSR
eukprot:309753_1